MSLLYRILYAAHASGTHHKIALRALEGLRSAEADAWRRVFLKHAAQFIEGSKAPDVSFRDFQNHVLHVDDDCWGGAREAATKWYGELVDRLRAGAWGEATFAAGVLTHYLSDPLMPLHTGSSEAETAMHRAAEWSISKSFEPLWDIAPEIDVAVPSGSDWLAKMLLDGAKTARAAYWPLIAHYDFARGSKRPADGFDAEGRTIVAPLLAQAVASCARAIDRALMEAGVAPPEVALGLDTVIAGISTPIKWVANRLEDREERALVQRMHREFVETGKVDKTLTEDVRVVRDIARGHAEARAAGRPVEAAPRADDLLERAPRPAAVARAAISSAGLRRDSPLERAPSIGPKTAARFEKIGVRTIGDLLACDPSKVAKKLGTGWIDAADVAQWRDQADLMVRLPRLRSSHAVMLVAAGYRDLRTIAGADPAQLRAKLSAAAKTDQVRRALRNPKAPDIGDVVEWIGKARGALAAA